MEFTHRRLKREHRTIEVMIDLYCREQHHSPPGSLCAECGELREYARARLERCVFQERKPTCAKCPVHCYKPDMRERVRAMMRYSGPRMLLHKPFLAIAHLLDGLRKAPPKPVGRRPA
jgi:predicted amidophosphoribosyltransferase